MLRGRTKGKIIRQLLMLIRLAGAVGGDVTIFITVVARNTTTATGFKGTVCIICNIRNPIPFINFFRVKSLSLCKRLRPKRSFGVPKVNKVSKGTKGCVEIFIRTRLHEFDNPFVNISGQMICMRKSVDNILELGIHGNHILSLIVYDLQSLKLVGEQHESFFGRADDKGTNN